MAERFLIVRLGAMGDVMHALPAVAALRHAHPEATIGWAIEDRWVELLSVRTVSGSPRSAQKPLVDNIHVVNTHAWRQAPFSDETWREIREAFSEMRAQDYEAAIDLQGAWKSAAVCWLSGARWRLGFNTPREYGARAFYHRRVEGVGTHVVEHAMTLVHELGATVRAEAISPNDLLPYDAAAERWCDEFLRSRNISDFVVISPGGGWGAKLWPAERFAEVARTLAYEGMISLINHAPSEAALAAEVAHLSAGAAMPVPCSLGELTALTRRALMFIGGDSGPMHLAAALRVPVVAIFGPTDPARNGPFATRSIVLRSPASLTSYRHARERDPGLLAITTAQVIAAAHQILLERARG